MLIKVLDELLYEEELVSGGFGPKKPGDAGIDLRARQTMWIPHDVTVAVPLGVAIQISEDEVGMLTGRSSTSMVRNIITSEGKIDSGYRGEIHTMLTAIKDSVKVERGERIAQLVIAKIGSPTLWVVADELNATERGSGKFGSTGVS
jgi:dUTP diphosphatase